MPRAIDQSRGSEHAFSLQHPEALRTLIQIARIQSVESSNAIEDVTAPHPRLLALVNDTTTPANRSEAEIAGYRAVLDTIHASALQIPFKPGVVEQPHRDLYQFTGVPAGHCKTVENSIEEVLPDGTRFVRFRTLSAIETPGAMDELHDRFDRDTYYEALQAAGIGWHTGEHDIKPWLAYFLGIVAAAYKEFESRVGAVAGRGSKRGAIRQFVRQSIADEFTVADVRRAAPAASQSYISKTLAKMRDEGLIEPIGAGKSARWRRIRSDF